MFSPTTGSQKDGKALELREDGVHPPPVVGAMNHTAAIRGGIFCHRSSLRAAQVL